jgi:hypothetical protein
MGQSTPPTGSSRALLPASQHREAGRISGQTECVELASRPDFHARYVEALTFGDAPHPPAAGRARGEGGEGQTSRMSLVFFSNSSRTLLS